MDLGFGGKNQIIGNALAKEFDKSALVQERAIIEEINKYDALLEADDSELEILRERRLIAMKKAQEQKQKWRALGHGNYTAIGEGQHGGDTAKEFFDVSKESDRLVVHFHRPSTRMCDAFHAHLEKLAAKHLETRFVKINVDQCAEDGAGGGASYLVDKLGIVVMPTIVIIKNRKAMHHIRGFDELGGAEDFSTEALEWVIGAHQGVKIPEGREMPEELQQGGGKGVNGVSITKRYAGGRRGGVREAHNAYDDSDEEY